jgi:hypothetical protein
MGTRARRRTREQLSTLGVVIVTSVALLLGWGVRTTLENRTRLITRDNVSAAVPDRWLVQDGTGDLILTTWDPLSPEVRYNISLVSATGSTLAEIAAVRGRSRVQLLNSFSVTEETPVERGGQEGYKVTFIYVSSDTGGPTIVKGVEYYFTQQEHVLVISLESGADGFDAALAPFQRFLDSVSVTEGG